MRHAVLLTVIFCTLSKTNSEIVQGAHDYLIRRSLFHQIDMVEA